MGIVYMISNLGGLGWGYIWLFVANVSVALGAFNVLPLPALDGGRLAVELWKRVSGRDLSEKAEGRYHTVGFVALMILVLIISVYDIRKFF